MNREVLLEVVLGLTVGLIVVVIAAFRSQRAPTVGLLRRAAMLALLTYAVIAAPVFTLSGMGALGMIGMLVVVGLALAGSVLSRKFDSEAQAVIPAQRNVQALVGTGVASVLLIAAAQTLSLVGRVDPRMMVLVVGVIAALLVAGQGLVASSRISSLAMWLMIVPILISLVLGFLLGSVSVVFSPARLAGETHYVAILAAAVSIFVLGWVDSSLKASARAGRWSPVRVLVWVLVVLLLILIGLLMFFGGLVIAPSMEFFVVPANIDALPGLAGLLLAVLTVIFAALVANALAGVGALGADFATQPVGSEVADSTDAEVVAGSDLVLSVSARWVWISAAVAVIIALIDPGSQRIVVVIAVVAAGLVGAQVSRGDIGKGSLAGVGVAVVATIVLAVIDQLELGWASVIATIAALLIGFVVGKSGSVSAQRQVGEQSPDALPSSVS